MSDVCDFTCLMPGENSVAVSARGLEDGSVSINGSQDLSQYIQFNNGGCVYGISIEPAASMSIYQYCMRVDAQGPSGLTSGSGYLYFIDATGDTYSLGIFDSSRKEHTLHYSSVRPQIIAIVWSDQKK